MTTRGIEAVMGEEQEWQDIASAPRDGSEILCHDGYDYSICRWNGRMWIGVCDGRMALESQGDTWTSYIEPSPTHWMPLPSPPEPGK